MPAWRELMSTQSGWRRRSPTATGSRSGSAGDVGGEVAGIHVGDRGYEGRTEEGSSRPDRAGALTLQDASAARSASLPAPAGRQVAPRRPLSARRSVACASPAAYIRTVRQGGRMIDGDRRTPIMGERQATPAGGVAGRADPRPDLPSLRRRLCMRRISCHVGRGPAAAAPSASRAPRRAKRSTRRRAPLQAHLTIGPVMPMLMPDQAPVPCRASHGAMPGIPCRRW